MADEVLKGLCLDAHPFAPTEDVRRGFSFAQKGVSLLSTLPIFQHPQLAQYYVQIGSFSDAVKLAEDTLKQRRFPTPGQRPPVILIQGSTAVGRSSLAEYVAHIVRERWKAKMGTEPSLKRLKIEGDNIARLMLTLKVYLKTHLQANAVADAVAIFETWKDDGGPTDPQDAVLEQLFTDLAEVTKGTPPLILIVRTITFDRIPWIRRLVPLLSALNVIPVFIADHPNVYILVRTDLPDVIGLRLGRLTAKQAEEFLKIRVRHFRDPQCTHAHSDLYPFDPDTISNAFADQPDGMAIRLLLEVMGGAFEELFTELEAKMAGGGYQPTAADLMVRWKHVGEGYRKRLSPGAQAARAGARP